MKRRYKTPEIKVVEFICEKGYAASFPVIISTDDSKVVENRDDSGNWLLSDDESFWNNSY